MKSCHTIRLSEVRIAIADNCDYYGMGRIITRINVPMEFRGLGYGRALLKQITDEADEERVILYLEVSPSDGLTFEQLDAWYQRHGFKRWRGMYRRRPEANIPVQPY